MRHNLLICSILSLAASFIVSAQERLSVAEFRALPANDKADYIISGVVTQYRNQTHGNLYLSDGTAEVLVYGILDENGQSDNCNLMDIQIGDTLTVCGPKVLYQGLTVEMKDATVLSHIFGPEHITELVTDLKSLDTQPEFKGKKSFGEWVNGHLTYPAAAHYAEAQGIVVVRVTIDEKGRVRNAHTIHGRHPALDREAERTIAKSPKWKPGTKDGKPVPVVIDYAIRFLINN